MENNSKIILYNSPDGKSAVALYASDGSVWLTQHQIAELFATSKQNVSLHVINILKEGELDSNSVVKNYLTTASDGKQYQTAHYSLDMILAIGFRVRGVRGTQFRQWANAHLKEYLVKGFTMDDERLKNPSGRPDYFDELLARIRDIRASEKRFYQKVRDLFSLSSDYDKTDKATQMFYAATQNKILYAITGKTAAEIIVERAAKDQPNMGLTSWKGNVVRKQDIYIAKNYLSKDEIDQLNRFVMVFLETAELRAQNRQDITMDFWRDNVDKIIAFNDKALLAGSGSVSNARMEGHVTAIYEEFDSSRKLFEARQADEDDLKELETLQKQIPQR